MRNINIQEFDSMAGKIVQRKQKKKFKRDVEVLGVGEGFVIALSEIDTKISGADTVSNKVHTWGRDLGRTYSVKNLPNDEFAIVRRS